MRDDSARFAGRELEEARKDGFAVRTRLNSVQVRVRKVARRAARREPVARRIKSEQRVDRDLLRRNEFELGAVRRSDDLEPFKFGAAAVARDHFVLDGRFALLEPRQFRLRAVPLRFEGAESERLLGERDALNVEFARGREFPSEHFGAEFFISGQIDVFRKPFGIGSADVKERDLKGDDARADAGQEP